MLHINYAVEYNHREDKFGPCRAIPHIQQAVAFRARPKRRTNCNDRENKFERNTINHHHQQVCRPATGARLRALFAREQAFNEDQAEQEADKDRQAYEPFILGHPDVERLECHDGNLTGATYLAILP